MESTTVVEALDDAILQEELLHIGISVSRHIADGWEVI